MDKTENIRKAMVSDINQNKESDNKETERSRLESEYGQVWDTEELSADFNVTGFMAPYVVAVNKETGQKGSMMFQHSPRFYFGWSEA